MRLQVNGEHRDVPSGCTVAQLLETLGAPQRGVAVELNLQVMPRSAHESTALADGDRVEVVTLVGGG